MGETLSEHTELNAETVQEMPFSAAEVLSLRSAENVEATKLYTQLMECTTIDELVANIFTDEAYPLLSLMTEQQLNDLYNHAIAVHNPETDDPEYYEWVIDAIIYAAEGNNFMLLATNWSGTVAGGAYSGDMHLTGDVTLSGTIKVEEGKTLNIRVGESNKTYTIKRGSFNGAMFEVAEGGRLRIQGNGAEGVSGSAIIVDGGAIWNINDPTSGSRTNSGKKASAAAIVCKGYLTLTDMTIQNNDNTSGEGGAIKMAANSHANGNTGVKADGSISRIVIKQCAATSGGAIKIDGGFRAIEDGDGDGYGFTVNNSKIYYNESSADSGGTIRTNGGTAGIYRFSGCEIYNNQSDGRGGAFYWNAAGTAETKLMIHNAKIHHNKAGSRGGAVMNESIMEITGSTEIYQNYAGESGGGLYLCTYNGSMAAFQGDGFNLTLGSDIKINNNVAEDLGGGIFLYIYNSPDVDKTNALYQCVINGAELTNNQAKNGGAIAISDVGTYDNYANRILTITEGSQISNNTASENGGAIYVKRTGTKGMTVSTTGTVKNNTATDKNGGAFYLEATGSATVTASFAGTLENNKAVNGDGGTVYLAGGNFTMNGGSIKGVLNTNMAHNGGAVYVNNGNFTMADGEITDVMVDENGGAVYVAGGSFTMTDGNVSGNSAANGGVAYVSGGSFTMNSGTMSDNTATTGNGGAAYVVDGTFTMNSGTMSGNTASQDGGAAFVSGGNFIMENGEFESNTATNGGAAYVFGGTFTMESGKMNNNTATSDGGAVYVNNGNTNIQSGTITNNIALGGGGAVTTINGNVVIGTEECYNAGESSAHIHPVIEDNIAADAGGICVNGGTTTMWCGDIRHNYIYEKTVNVLVSNGNFIYNGGTIGIPYDTGVFVTGGEFDDNVSEAEGKIKHELHYHSVIGDEVHNGKIPESKWIASPRGDILNIEDCNDISPTWSDLFPDYEFVGWEQGESTDEVVNFNAIWEKRT